MLFRHGKTLIQRYIQQEYINPRFAEKPPIGPIAELGDQGYHLSGSNFTRLGNATGLQFSISGTYVRVQTRRRGCYRIGRNRRGERFARRSDCERATVVVMTPARRQLAM